MPRTACLLLVAALAPSAAAAPPTVESVLPGVGQRGTAFTVVLAGARLTNPQELMIYGRGLTCTKLEADGENAVRATLSAAADCPLGEHAFRLRTSGGASELRTVSVTPLKVIPETEPNDTDAKALKIPLDSTISGVIESGDADWFEVELKKGQRLSAEVEAVRLGGDELLDTVLAIHGPDGTPLAAADDTPLFHQDPFVSVLAPTDGVYRVMVREGRYGGGESARYALHVGSFVRPAIVYPLGGPANGDIALTLIGDPAGKLTEKIKLPAGGPFGIHTTAGSVACPTPNPFRVSPFPNVLETEAAKAAAWPVAFNGIVEKPAEIDTFRLSARKGDALRIETFAYRLGSPIDAIVSVVDSNGHVLAAGDDGQTHDPEFRFVAPADGEYALRVADKRGNGGPGFVYRVEVTRAEPSLAVFLPGTERKSQAKQTIAVPRGNRITAYLAVRRDGCDGPVSLEASGLPAGVKLVADSVRPGEYHVPVVFEAAADAPIGGSLVEIAGKCGNATGHFHQVIDHARGPGDSSFHSTVVDRLAVVVVDETPFSISLPAPAAPLPVDGTLDLAVRVDRRKGFEGPVEVYLTSLPPCVDVPASVVVPADKSEATIPLTVQPGADVGTWKVVAEAKPFAGRKRGEPTQFGGLGMAGADPTMPADPAAAGGRRRRKTANLELTPVASGIVPIAVAAAPVAGRFAPIAAEQGKTVRIVCELKAERPLPAGFVAKLDGLPPRATAEPIAVAAGATRLEFTVSVAATTPPGAHETLVAELTGEIDGRRIVYRVGRFGLLKVDPPGAVKTDENGRPLSPLDALRRERAGN